MRHSAQFGREIGLAVMILRATGQNPTPDPIIWNTGGPGGSAIDDYGDFLATSPLRNDRDIVLVDQRGSGHSFPALDCPDLPQTEEGTVFDEAYYGRIGAALVACSSKFGAQGIDLSAFNPIESAMDVEDLRVALGYGKVNLYGVSYGSLVAQETLRRYSPSIRSVVLDGVFPPGIDPMVVDEDIALDKVFNACGARPECVSMYPNVRHEYYELIDRLNPSLGGALGQTDPANDPPADSEITGDMFKVGLHTLMYVEGMVPYVPLIVHAASQRDFYPLAYVLSLLSSGPLTAGAYWAAYCRIAGSAASSTGQALACANYLRETAQAPPTSLLEGSPHTAEMKPDPVTSDVPVLLLNGEYDPITPPSYGYLVAKTLPNSTVVVFPGGAHAAFGGNECAAGLMERFYNAPEASLGLSCIEDFPALEFRSRLDVTDFFPAGNPPLGYSIVALLYGLRLGGAQTALRIVLGSVGALWLMLLVFGGLTLCLGPAQRLTLLRRGPPGKSPPALTRLLPVWSLAFIAAVSGLLGYLATYGWGILAPSGIDTLQPWVLPLPFIVGLSCLLNMASTYSGLSSGAWPVRRRVLQLGITIPAACLTLALIILGGLAGWP
jgi:pimeloyl-ACP methyl ester carboxylesterase